MGATVRVVGVDAARDGRAFQDGPERLERLGGERLGDDAHHEILRVTPRIPKFSHHAFDDRSKKAYKPLLVPQNAAIIAVLILERPMCLECIATKGSLTTTEVEHYLQEIGLGLELLVDQGRCRTCGEPREVFSLSRLP